MLGALERRHGAAPAASGLRVDPARHVLTLLAFGALPLLLLVGFTLGVIGHRFAFDFHTFWEAGRRVLDGRSPYPAPGRILAAPPPDGAYDYFAYPPPFVLAVVPLAALPFGVAAAVFTVASVAACFAVLRLLGVWDWRCYGIALGSIPVLSTLRLGALGLLLALAAAVAWRFRDRWPIVGAAVGCALVAKLFLWPLVLWLLVTRRLRAAALALVGAVVATALSWAAIGWSGFHAYPTLLRDLSRLDATRSYSLVALADRLGLPAPSATWLLLAAPAALALAWAWRRGSTGAERDRRAFVAAIALALLLTPILWPHYFALLLVPIALVSPRLGWAWLPLALFWISPLQQPSRHPTWQLLAVLAIAAAGVVAALRPTAPARRHGDDQLDGATVRMPASRAAAAWRSS